MATQYAESIAELDTEARRDFPEAFVAYESVLQLMLRRGYTKAMSDAEELDRQHHQEFDCECRHI